MTTYGGAHLASDSMGTMTCNLTLGPVDDSILHMCYYYFGAGLLAAIVEAINLVVTMRMPYALSHNFFIICLKFANFFNGASYVILGGRALLANLH
ncbi:hypothetical protein AAVH_13898 [Aphelenchoides avenae]|nr:hypothetical protein AAVH_13898 [Aphelenchus avenae]